MEALSEADEGDDERESEEEERERDEPRSKKKRSKLALRLGIGHETITARAGSVRAGEEAVEFAEASARRRADWLHEILPARVSNRKTFRMVAARLGGDNGAGGGDLAGAYRAIAGRDLRADLANAFPEPARQRYLLDVLERGEPGLASRMSLAHGDVTGTRADKKRMIALFREATPAERLEAVTSHGTELEQALGKKKRKRDKLLRRDVSPDDLGGKDVEELRHLTQISRLLAKGDPSDPELIEACDRYLAARVEAHNGVAGLKRKQLAAELMPLLARLPDEVRAGVAARHSRSRYAAALRRVKLGRKGWRRTSNINYLLGIAAAPTREDGVEYKHRDPARSQAAYDRDPAVDADNVAELDLYIRRKEERQRFGKVQGKLESLGGIEERIARLNNAERDAFLRRLIGGAGPLAGGEREDALAELDRRLGAARLSSGARERIRLQLDLGGAATAASKHSTHARLRDLTFSKLPKARFATKAARIATQLRGDEWLEVRRDQALMQRLRERCGSKGWAALERLFGARSNDLLHDPLTGLGRTPDRDDEARAQQHAADAAELSSEHWAQVLDVALGHHMRTWDRAEIDNLVNRAVLTAQRSGDPDAFLADVEAGMSERSRSLLAGGRLGNAGRALREHRVLTAHEQLDDLRFRKISPKRLRGREARAAEVTAAFDDVRGAALIEQWSNIDQVRARLAADPDSRPMLDIDRDLRRRLKGMLPRGEYVTTLKQMRLRLARAVEEDAEAHAVLARAGLRSDGYARVQLEVAAEVEEQRLKDTGKQWDRVFVVKGWADADERKEARNIAIARLRTARAALDRGEDLDGDAIDRIERGREDLAERTAAHDGLRKKANRVATIVVQVALALAGAAAMAPLQVVGIPAWALPWAMALAAVGVALGKGVASALVKRWLQGDAFNTTEELTALVTRALIAGALGCVNAGLAPGLLSVLDVAADAEAGEGVFDAVLRGIVVNAMRTAAREGTRAAVDEATTTERRIDDLGAELLVRLTSILRAAGANIGAEAGVGAVLEATGLAEATDPLGANGARAVEQGDKLVHVNRLLAPHLDKAVLDKLRHKQTLGAERQPARVASGPTEAPALAEHAAADAALADPLAVDPTELLTLPPLARVEALLLWGVQLLALGEQTLDLSDYDDADLVARARRLCGVYEWARGTAAAGDELPEQELVDTLEELGWRITQATQARIAATVPPLTAEEQAERHAAERREGKRKVSADEWEAEGSSAEVEGSSAAAQGFSGAAAAAEQRPAPDLAETLSADELADLPPLVDSQPAVIRTASQHAALSAPDVPEHAPVKDVDLLSMPAVPIAAPSNRLARQMALVDPAWREPAPAVDQTAPAPVTEDAQPLDQAPTPAPAADPTAPATELAPASAPMIDGAGADEEDAASARDDELLAQALSLFGPTFQLHERAASHESASDVTPAQDPDAELARRLAALYDDPSVPRPGVSLDLEHVLAEQRAGGDEEGVAADPDRDSELWARLDALREKDELGPRPPVSDARQLPELFAASSRDSSEGDVHGGATETDAVADAEADAALEQRLARLLEAPPGADDALAARLARLNADPGGPGRAPTTTTLELIHDLAALGVHIDPEGEAAGVDYDADDEREHDGDDDRHHRRRAPRKRPHKRPPD